ncbi:hypothetical protein RJT34_16279 [Clitoria ternatea]|uniref:Secreted protein n=1 Tax=Clitoria ternatea TaxID=43366 RepID=A0AAN9J823_CLITE
MSLSLACFMVSHTLVSVFLVNRSCGKFYFLALSLTLSLSNMHSGDLRGCSIFSPPTSDLSWLSCPIFYKLSAPTFCCASLPTFTFTVSLLPFSIPNLDSSTSFSIATSITSSLLASARFFSYTPLHSSETIYY